jgi:MFS family permease
MTYLTLLRTRPAYRRLWAAELISQVGDWFSLVAVSVVSLSAPGGGVMVLATALAAHLLPQTLAAPFGGWLADRLDKRRVLVGSAVLEGALTVGMAFAAAAGSVLPLQLLLVLRSIASSAREPAAGAALPRLVEPSELRMANTLGAVTWSVSFAVGMALGGLATTVGATFALALDAVTFAIAGVLLARLPPLLASEPNAGRAATPLSDIARAFQIAWRPELRRSVFAFAPIALVSGAGWIALNLASQEQPLAAGAATTLGALQAIRGIGTGVGPMLLRKRAARWGAVAATATAAGAAFMAWAPSFWLAAFSAFLWGAGGGAIWVLLTTEIQEASEEQFRGRMIAFAGIAFATSMAAGALVTALLFEQGFSIRGTSASIALASLLVWTMLRRASTQDSR